MTCCLTLTVNCLHAVKLKAIACITCYLHVVCVVRWHGAVEDILMMFFELYY